jgi:hypothetical protein
VPDQGKNDNDRNGYTQQPQQNSTAHRRILQQFLCERECRNVSQPPVLMADLAIASPTRLRQNSPVNQSGAAADSGFVSAGETSSPKPKSAADPSSSLSVRRIANGLAVRSGVATGLGVLFPPPAILSTIQCGVGDDQRCKGWRTAAYSGQRTALSVAGQRAVCPSTTAPAVTGGMASLALCTVRRHTVTASRKEVTQWSAPIDRCRSWSPRMLSPDGHRPTRMGTCGNRHRIRLTR